MAGDWIAASKGLTRKREVCHVSSRTGRSRHEVVGLLIEFWDWAESETEDGQLPQIKLPDLVGIIGGDLVFWEAVTAAGWLQVVTGDGIVIPNFTNWMGEAAKKRLKDTRRKKASRVRVLSGSQADKNVTREEKRREEKNKDNPLPPSEEKGEKEPKTKKKEKPAPLPEIPAALNTSEFRDAWADWLIYRAERKKTVTATSAKQAFAMCEKIGPTKAVVAMRRAIANGWQGFIFPEDRTHGPPGGEPVGRRIPDVEATRRRNEEAMRGISS